MLPPVGAAAILSPRPAAFAGKPFERNGHHPTLAGTMLAANAEAVAQPSRAALLAVWIEGTRGLDSTWRR